MSAGSVVVVVDGSVTVRGAVETIGSAGRGAPVRGSARCWVTLSTQSGAQAGTSSTVSDPSRSAPVSSPCTPGAGSSSR